ncbi:MULTISPECIES: hypothetical protein [Cupriavidus]|uniref:PRTase-CE domain-containing protein n=1 Tax=Cupriavidus basilensis TaxID=68895 RepID=A0A643G0H0_9BURK|nr:MULTISPECIES: hypothetical protein [Cupriavidus]KUE88084.1 hypothetical protein ASL20_15540 [Cupriavidus necator]NOV23505.1 hypothetical protein [Cupriavidus necator]QOT81588.1 hypothetical protein F7R26_036805 [Cupriavidus basilensis]BDB30214.1 hypothetical protein CTP10_R76310 [Cupriavidus sp. P-10]
MSQIPQIGSFDQLSVERAVHWLSRTGVRSPLSVERIKQWVKQFQAPEEKTLAWLILRNLIFRTNEQLQSSMRQALKQATIHFVDQLGLRENVAWNDALKRHAGLTFYCGPPSLPTFGLPTQPGKSGDLIARLINQRYGIDKQYPSDVKVLPPDERFIVVDDGTYTGVQLANFLRGWDIDFSHGRVAIAVAMAHKTACEHLKKEFPNVPLIYGELLTADMCFQSLSQKWIETGQWSYEKSPLEVYDDVHKRNQPFANGNGGNGYGNIGALVAFEHGVPDDSIQLLWDVSPSWKPLVER